MKSYLEQAFGRGDVTSARMQAAIREWLNLYYGTQSPGEDTADRLGVHPMQTAQEVVQNSDVVILAVKPYLIEQVVAPLKELLKGKMVVSVAAGFTFARYQQLLDESTHHISTIPNTPIASARVS